MTSSKILRVLAVSVFAAIPVFIPVSQGWSQAIDEIVVTTRYKEESLQEVPLAITAIGADAIIRKGISDLYQIAELDPSVSFDTSYGPGDTRVAIRGLSNTRGRSNVAFLVDGVDVTSENQIAAGSGLLANQRLLSDVERIEIVKGPQNALYGRAAFAGAIAYKTKDPTETLEGSLGVDLAEGNELQFRGALSGPVTDTLGFRLDGVVWTADGRFKNSVSGADLGGGEGWGTSGALLWEPTDTFDIKGRIAYSEDENSPRPTVLPQSDTFAAYPKEMYEGGVGVGGSFFAGYQLGPVNHGTYCPDLGVWNDGNPLDPDFGNTLPGVAPGTPGICQPGNFGGVSDLPQGKNSITHSETMDGKEQPGSTLDMFRASVTANWELPAGMFTFIGGYTDADQTDMHDQDMQAFGRPDRLGANDPFFDYGSNLSVAGQQSDTETNTRQVSAELRFSTNFEGPVNGTVGYLRWDQKVSTLDRNYIASCMLAAADFTPGSENVITGFPTVRDETISRSCDGQPSPLLLFDNNPVSGDTVDNWQEYIRQYRVTDATVGIADSRTVLVPGRNPGAPWVSDTKHQSIYAQVAWDISEKLKLTGEARWVDERFSMSRPNQSSCGNISTAFGVENGATILSAWLKEGTGNVPDLNCSSVSGLGTFNDWAIIEASLPDSFIVPKATLEWFINDTDMMYFSWAKAQKPAGINQLAAGGSAVNYDDLPDGSPSKQFFPAEKMTTWEIGTKTSWEAAGTLIANGAVFFNDYTDKQMTSQFIDEFGAQQPSVISAPAEVLGVEVDLNWLPAAIEGLSIRLAYTWQDATYKDFKDATTTVQRVAANGKCNVVDLAPPGADEDLFCEIDLGGNQLERQARNAFSSNFSYVRPLPGSMTEWFLEGDVSYTSKRYLDHDNFNYFDSFWLTNFRLGLQTDEWDVVLFVDNAFDDDTFRSGGPGPDFGLQNTRLGFIGALGMFGFFGIMPDPRTAGIRTNFRFGG